MQVLVRSDHTVTSTEGLTAAIEQTVNDALYRFANRITRVEVFLSDENAQKGGTSDKRCNTEAHLGGVKPIAAHAHGGTFHEAVVAAVDKLERAIEHELQKLEESSGPSPPESQIASTTELEELERTDAARRRPTRRGRAKR